MFSSEAFAVHCYLQFMTHSFTDLVMLCKACTAVTSLLACFGGLQSGIQQLMHMLSWKEIK